MITQIFSLCIAILCWCWYCYMEGKYTSSYSKRQLLIIYILVTYLKTQDLFFNSLPYSTGTVITILLTIFTVPVFLFPYFYNYNHHHQNGGFVFFTKPIRKILFFIGVLLFFFQIYIVYINNLV